MEYVEVPGSKDLNGVKLTIGTMRPDYSDIQYLRIDLEAAIDAGFQTVDDLVNRSRLAITNGNPYPFVEIVHFG